MGVGIWGAAKQFSSSFSGAAGTGVQWYSSSGSREHFNIWPRDGKWTALACPNLGPKYPKVESLSLVKTDTLLAECLYLLSHLSEPPYFILQRRACPLLRENVYLLRGRAVMT